MNTYDLIIVGAGPAGISAAIYSACRGKKVLVLEKNKIGGMIGNVSTITHYVGALENESGKEFAERLKKQAELYDIKFIFEEVKEFNLKDGVKKVITDKNSYEAKAIILANGTTPRKLDIVYNKNLAGKNILLNAQRDAELFKDKNVFVVGASDGAVKEAIFLSKFAKKVLIITFEEKISCIAEFKTKISSIDNIEILTQTNIKSLKGIDKLEVIELCDLRDNSIKEIKDSDAGVFIYSGSTPNTELLSFLELKDGYILTNENLETSIKGVFAVGDIRVKNIRQVSTAVCDGTVAAINACKLI